MPSEITMPQLSDTMTEGTLLKWHKKEGDKVKEGEVIADIETDKANMEMEAFEAGTVALLAAKEGEKVKVGDRIAVLATAGENVADIKKQFAAGAPSAGVARAEKSADKPQKVGQSAAADNDDADEGEGEESNPVLEQGRAQSRRELVGAGENESSEALARGAAEITQRHRESSGNGGAGTATAAPPMTDRREGRLRVSPLARRIAEDRGIDLSRLRGSGPGGRIVQRDVEEAGKAGGGAVAPAAAAGATPGPKPPAAPLPPLNRPAGQKEVIPLTKMRSVIASRLQQSKQTVPHFYETIDVDVEELSKLRARLNEQLEGQNIRLSLGDLIAKAVAHALLSHAAVNATFDGKEITRYADVNLGMAVALPEGLIVPVLRGINHMGLREIRQRSADLIDRARAQKLKQDELSGATFTVSNLGTYGVREFSAIINPPEVAILAIGAAEKRAVVKNDQIIPRTMMTLTLSDDHRAVDGATAAEFLRTLKGVLEEPGMMLV